MNLRISRPLSEGLSKEPEDDPSQTPQCYQAHVRHDRRDVATLDSPGCDELAEPVSPNILIDRDCNENRARNWLVRVDTVRRGNRWKCCNLNSCAGIPDDHDDLLNVSTKFRVGKGGEHTFQSH